jgi:molybdopterin molybdotransferase
MMDGIAIRYSDWHDGIREFRISGIQRAGEPAKSVAESGTALEVMTGAVCPLGADLVIPYEEIHISDNKAQIIPNSSIAQGQHIHKKGTDKHLGEMLVPVGTKLNAAHLAIAASCGAVMLKVIALPKVCIISTGDELVDPLVEPKDYQIRRSNAYALKALLQPYGIEADLVHAMDNAASLEQTILGALHNYDVILMSGGVSKGKFDLVPEVLQGLGVRQVFHKIAQKPGKPLWFGVHPTCTVFGFPGNPVSTYLCAIRYFIPWLQRGMQWMLAPLRATCSTGMVLKGTLTQFVQVQLQPHGARWMATWIIGKGSGDFANLGRADGFLEIPATKKSIEPGDEFDAWMFG